MEPADVDSLITTTRALTDEVHGLRDDLSKYQTKKESFEALVALRLRIRFQTYILFTIAIVLILAAIGVGAFVLHEQAQQRKVTCEERNSQAEQAIPFYDRYIDRLKTGHSDPVLIDLITQARAMSVLASKTEC